jgi:hypothetical protein
VRAALPAAKGSAPAAGSWLDVCTGR